MTVEYDRGELAGVIAEAITNHLMATIQPSTAAEIREVLKESCRIGILTSAVLHPEFESNPAACVELFQLGGFEPTSKLIRGVMRPRAPRL